MTRLLIVVLSSLAVLGLILGVVLFMIERGIPPFQDFGIKGN